MSSDRFVFERIVDARNIHGHWEYFVKWRDYPESSCSWEPEANFDHDDVASFWQTHKRRDFIHRPEESFVPANSLELTTPDALQFVRSAFPRITSPQDIVEIIRPVRKKNGKVYYWVKTQKYARPVRLPARLVRQLQPELLVEFLESNLAFL
jgi:hypothetical protein